MSLGATSLIPGVWVARSARQVESPIYYPAVTKRRLSQGVPRSCSRDLRILVCMQTNLPLLSMVAGEEYRPYLGEVGLAAKLQTSHLPLCMVAPPSPPLPSHSSWRHQWQNFTGNPFMTSSCGRQRGVGKLALE